MTRKAYFPGKFKTRAAEDGGKYIEGYFIVFNQRTELWPGWFEEIAPEAVAGSLAGNDIRCLFNHNTDIVLGRKGAGTLTLRADDYGVFGSVLINEEDGQALDIYARVKRGDITGCSFGFNVRKEEFRDLDGMIINRLLDIDIAEVSVCPFPAYPQTEIAARKKAYEDNIIRSRTMMRENIRTRIKSMKI